MRRLFVVLTFVPLFTFVVGLIIGMLATEDPLDIA